jgi:hypothetical protein
MEGRDRVTSVTALRPTPPKRDTGSVPELQCTRPDSSLWGVRVALADAQAPLVVLIFRHPDGQDQAAEHDAKAGLAAILAVHEEAPKFRAVAAAAIDTGPTAKERWEEARQSWERHPPGVPAFPAADELMWAPGRSHVHRSVRLGCQGGAGGGGARSVVARGH